MFNFIHGNKDNNFVDGKIAEMQVMVSQRLPIAAKSGDANQYSAARIQFNILILEATFGFNYERDSKIKFNKKLPTDAQVIEIVRLVNTVCTSIENVSDPNDINNIPNDCNVPHLEKINYKNVTKYITGNQEGSGILSQAITAIDVLELVSIGKALRKKQIQNRMLLIGGIALLITVAGCATIMVMKSKSEKAVTDEVAEPDAEVDVDDTDVEISDEDMSDMDSPSVDMDE